MSVFKALFAQEIFPNYAFLVSTVPKQTVTSSLSTDPHTWRKLQIAIISLSFDTIILPLR
jgi:hypothetical protein